MNKIVKILIFILFLFFPFSFVHAEDTIENSDNKQNVVKEENVVTNESNTQTDKKEVKFNEELDRILLNSENEQKELKSILVGSEHVLLSMLNPNNNCEKIQEVFKNIGIDYNFIINKCTEKNKKENTSNNKKKILKAILKLIQKKIIMKIKK